MNGCQWEEGLTPTPWRGGPYNVPRVIANHGGHIIVEVTLPNKDPSRDDDLTLQIQIDPLAVEVVAYVADMELGSKVWGLSDLHEEMY